MIFDSWKNLLHYKGISPQLDRALDLAAALDFSSAENGRHEAENAVYYIKSSMQTRDIEEMDFEAHRRYLDLFLVLSGEERIAVAPLETLHETKEYDSAEDYLLLKGRATANIILRPGAFAICFPSDGHISGGKVGRSASVCDRVVVKIPL